MRVEAGDCLEVMARLKAEGVVVDAVVTDPPYHLTTAGRFGAAGAKGPRDYGKSGAYKRAAAGFMGKAWDGGDIAFDPATWRLAFDLLKPGGHLLAFGGTRTVHRIASAIEDAGFEIRDMIMWLYGSGFPKSKDQAKAIDAHLGAKGETVANGAPVRRIRPGADQHKDGSWEKLTDRIYQPGEYVPATPEAAAWQGWGTALKPACEPIVLARKPPDGTVAANLLKHGTGALNIGGCTIAAPDGKGNWPITERRHDDKTYTLPPTPTDQSKGRWPANVAHDGSAEVEAAFAAFGDAPGQQRAVNGEDRSNVNVFAPASRPDRPYVPRGDSGTAARFFYTAKAGAEDRWGSKHPTVKPVALMRWLARLVTPPGGTLLDPFAGSGTAGVAALAEGLEAVLIERDAEYLADIRERLAFYAGAGRHSLAGKNRKSETPGAEGLPLFGAGET